MHQCDPEPTPACRNYQASCLLSNSHNPNTAPATRTTATAPLTATPISFGAAAPVEVAAAALLETLLATSLALLEMELTASDGRMEVDRSEVACATPAEVADANAEDALAPPSDRAEDALAPTSDVAEARSEEPAPMREVALAPMLEVTPSRRDSMSFWAEVRARRVATKASLENCILALFVVCFCLEGLEWRSGVGYLLFVAGRYVGQFWFLDQGRIREGVLPRRMTMRWDSKL